MANLHLLQRRRRDGSMALTGKSRSAVDPDRVFPDEFDFGFAQIGEGTYPARVEGDKITLEYVNAKATYNVVGPLRVASGTDGKYTDRADQGYHAVLDPSSVELFDAPDIDQTKADELAAAKEANKQRVPADVVGASLAQGGTPTINEDGA